MVKKESTNIELFPNAEKKRISWSLDFIERLKSESAYSINCNKDNFLHNSKALIQYKKGAFEVKVICDNTINQEFVSNQEAVFKDKILSFSRNENTIEIDGNLITHWTTTWATPIMIAYYTNNILWNKEKEQYYWRLIIPISHKANFDFFERRMIKIKDATFPGLVETSILDRRYNFFYYNNRELEKYYLCIDGLDMCSKDIFKKDTNSILFAYSIFTGNLYVDEHYYIGLDNLNEDWKSNHLEFINHKSSILSHAKIIDSYQAEKYLEAYGKKDYIEKVGVYVDGKKLTTISEKLRNNKKLERIIMLLLEANATKSLILRCSVYAVALETLSNIIYNENTTLLKPIKDSEVEKKIIDSFTEIVDTYDFVINKEGADILRKKIKSINKPLNADKLLKSFEIMGIKLNPHDIQSIKSRNSFLHGSSPKKVKGFESNDNKKITLHLLGNKLHFLLSCLLLKYCGFKGGVINKYTTGKKNHGQEIDEDFFRFL